MSSRLLAARAEALVNSARDAVRVPVLNIAAVDIVGTVLGLFLLFRHRLLRPFTARPLQAAVGLALPLGLLAHLLVGASTPFLAHLNAGHRPSQVTLLVSALLALHAVRAPPRNIS